ncbi:MAG: DNA-binding response OmpR family regulator [Oceanicoccus sp.]|jgi:DNA-binding response OmpR family regulator
MSPHILIADDDIELCTLLTDFLQLEGFTISSVHNGDEAVQEFQSKKYDLMVLDIMLPGKQGLDVLRAVRNNSDLPIVMLTARGDDTDRILGLELGADDYVPKPCNPKELAARVRAVLRRAQNSQHNKMPSQLSTGDLLLDVTRRELYYQQQAIHLTSTEFEILQLLMQRAGSVVDKENISSEVLKRKLAAYDRSIDVHISNIRKKLGQFGIDEDLIKNIRGVGYQFTQAIIEQQE